MQLVPCYNVYQNGRFSQQYPETLWKMGIEFISVFIYIYVMATESIINLIIEDSSGDKRCTQHLAEII